MTSINSTLAQVEEAVELGVPRREAWDRVARQQWLEFAPSEPVSECWICEVEVGKGDCDVCKLAIGGPRSEPKVRKISRRPVEYSDDDVPF